jgi:hypothetical protein
LWIEQTQWGYKIANGRGRLFAHFPSAEWALPMPMAMAITGRRLTSPEVMSEQLELFDFAGGPR